MTSSCRGTGLFSPQHCPAAPPGRTWWMCLCVAALRWGTSWRRACWEGAPRRWRSSAGRRWSDRLPTQDWLTARQSCGSASLEAASPKDSTQTGRERHTHTQFDLVFALFSWDFDQRQFCIFTLVPSCAEDIPLAVLLLFCSEGDNIPDAFTLMNRLNDWLHLLDNPVSNVWWKWGLLNSSCLSYKPFKGNEFTSPLTTADCFLLLLWLN